MDMLQSDITTEKFDHLGIVAGMLRELRLKERINEALGENCMVTGKLTVGDCVGAMVLNGLGFTNRALYLVSSFLQGKPVDRLLGDGLSAENFTDDSLGASLDRIADLGPTELFSVVAFGAALDNDLMGRTARLDSTSFSLHGQYQKFELDSPESAQLITINRGHSKQHRPDLKQVVLNLVNTGEAGMPLWAEALSGNSSDKNSFHKTVTQLREFQKRLTHEVPDFIWVADSALYTKKYLLSADYPFSWISRVPETIREAKALVEKPDSSLDWSKCEKDGYKVSSHSSTLEGVPQLWFLFYSEEAWKREIKTYDKNLKKEFEKLKKECWHLGNESFACTADAKKCLSKLMKKHPRFIARHTIKCKPKYEKNGRPGKNNPKIGEEIFIKVSLIEDSKYIETEKARKGRFIIATNELDQKKLTAEQALSEYKGLHKVERGFRFLKDPAFFVDKIYLKTPNRIAALMAVMTFTLMVYNFGEYTLRKRLKENSETLPNQLRKEIERPTLRWVFQLMDGVSVINVPSKGDTMQRMVSNLDGIRLKIVRIFSGSVARCYGLRPG